MTIAPSVKPSISAIQTYTSLEQPSPSQEVLRLFELIKSLLDLTGHLLYISQHKIVLICQQIGVELGNFFALRLDLLAQIFVSQQEHFARGNVVTIVVIGQL
ncbi:hypothetical protein BpHYR1_005140 [Brachionus plicatilis]|uniref:Uncharacterized protein n=1 Tax=Brachionus plicatilis TaxID=10195 RepID=A0A3M7SP93_BRAPC|nr:hypothetical protein BpHYR1_005140 [Brachionus plicatilis]